MTVENNNPKSSPWLKIKKTLSECSVSDLTGLIAELYLLSNSNKNFLEARFLRDEGVLERYKAQIKKYLAPDDPWKESQQISLRDAKKVLSDYKKATGDKIGLVSLMVYYVESGTDFLCEFGDMYEQYYASLESVFDSALKIMAQFDAYEVEDFIERLKIVVKKAGHMGWGYYDSISEMLHKAYPENLS